MTLACEEGLCGFFRCEDVVVVEAPRSEVERVQFVRPGLPMGAPRSGRWWRRSPGLRDGAEPVMTFRWYAASQPLPPPPRPNFALPSGRFRKHHIFPQAEDLARWFKGRGMVGRVSGSFSPLFMQNPWSLYLLREALERLQQEGIRGLRGCPMELRRFRGRNPPELLEAEFLIRGELHPDCLPPDAKTCERCSVKNYSLPDPYILDAATLPTDVDLFRIAGWSSLIIATERFVDTVKRLGLDGVVFREVPAR